MSGAGKHQPGFASSCRSDEHGFTSLCRSAEHGFESSCRSAEHGFTLIEMLVVMAIMGLIAGLAFPAIERMLVRQELESATRAVDLALRQTRADALLGGRPARFALSGDRRAFGDGARPGVVVPDGIGLSLPGAGIVFFGDGGSTGGSVVVSARAGQRHVDVDPQTGVVS